MDQLKETVVERRGDGFAFRLPYQHDAELLPRDTQVRLSMPNAGGVYEVLNLVEDAEEIRIVVGVMMWEHGSGVGPEIAAPTGYPFPTMSEELERLKADYVSAGGERTRPDAWAQGTSWNDHTRRLRDEIRQLRAG